ncbi:MaoC/PaaZ C-terminal domain-containing protein [Phytoactinopolyspora halotolerans]|uniref:Dehydratase n=1 Tax=Phytoactinopolyspora halotolerans TaxID=1981512 RepID=A0A6L9SE66_9ACTN|nr:MaoC/PaaZ C-terminal domain-containing protein [Phytoactinopolyspora halotolerans]NEE03319.1 dehydratase [Phytoactinopolyspora halotolerans]
MNGTAFADRRHSGAAGGDVAALGREASRRRGAKAGIAVGAVVAKREFRLTRESLLRYAGASGDVNPIHWSQRVAESVGLPGVIGHGMLTMALGGRLLTDWLGDPVGIVEYGVRFSHPVVVPDDDDGIALRMIATVAAVRDDGLIEVEIDARVDDTRVLARTRAVVRRPAGCL